MAAFPIVDDPEGTAFVAWTTTPWTLPSNLALCVNANFVYVKVGQLVLILPTNFHIDESRILCLRVLPLTMGYYFTLLSSGTILSSYLSEAYNEVLNYSCVIFLHAKVDFRNTCIYKVCFLIRL